MAKTLFTWELGGGLGHVAPLTPLFARLIATGHHVVVAIRNSSAASELLQCANIETHAAPHLVRDFPDRFSPARTFSHILHGTGFHSQDVLLGLVQRWKRLLDDVRPDLVVCDHSPLAVLTLRSLKIPHALIGTGFCCPPASAFTRPFLEWPGDTPQTLQKIEEIVRDNANAVLRQLGGPTLGRLADLFEDVKTQLLLTYFETDHFPERKQPNYLGIMIPRLGAPVAWPEPRFPKVFAYLRTFPNIEGLLRLLRVSQLNVLVQSDDFPVDRRLLYITERLRFVTGPCDVASAMSTCDLAITNGNHGMTCAALLAGKPVLMIPIVIEQYLLARRVLATGAALLGETHELDSIIANLKTLLQDKSHFAAAMRFSAHRAAEQATVVDRVTACIEQLLGSTA